MPIIDLETGKINEDKINQQDQNFNQPASQSRTGGIINLETGGFIEDEAAEQRNILAQQQLQAQQAAVAEANRPEKSFADMLGDAGRSIAANITEQTENLKTGASTLATVGSAAVAEPVAGLSGLISLPVARIGRQLGFTDKDTAEVGTEVINTVRDALTINPNAGAQEVLQSVAQNPVIQQISQASQTGSQATGDFLADIGEAIGGEEGRAIGGALGKTAFAGGEILLGGAVGRGVSATGKAIREGVEALPEVPIARQAEVAIQQSIPEAKDLKAASSEIFKGIDEQGIKLNNTTGKKFIDSVDKEFSSTTFDETISPKTFRLVQNLRDKVEAGEKLGISEVDNVKKVLGQVSRDINNKTDAAAANIVSRKIDQLYDAVDNKLGQDFKSARKLFVRGLKTEKVDDVIERAKNSPSGFEKGLQTELRKVLNNKKESRKFNENEKAIMKDVVRGSGKSKILNLLSKFDLGSTDKLRMTGLLLSGGAAGLTGGGAVALPILGKIASVALEKAAKGKANVLRELTAAGDNARDIAKAYIKNTPKKDRNAEDLTGLLLRPEVELKDLKNIKQTNEVTRKAVSLAKQIKEATTDTGTRTGAALTAPLVTEKEGKKPFEINITKSLEKLKGNK